MVCSGLSRANFWMPSQPYDLFILQAVAAAKPAPVPPPSPQVPASLPPRPLSLGNSPNTSFCLQMQAVIGSPSMPVAEAAAPEPEFEQQEQPAFPGLPIMVPVDNNFDPMDFLINPQPIDVSGCCPSCLLLLST